MIGLDHPEDLTAWSRWQRRRNVLRETKAAASTLLQRREPSVDAVVLHVADGDPRLLVALDATTPTKIAALIRPMRHLAGRVPVAVLAPGDISAQLPGEGWAVRRIPRTLAGLDAQRGSGGTLSRIDSVMSAGHYLPVGSLLDAWAQSHGLRKWIVQHGLLTPKAPPLPHEAHLLAFTEADGRFWASGRRDIEIHPVGSQLLHEAGRLARVGTKTSAAPVFLGQLHGVELSKPGLVASTRRFCRDTGAVYRPHPGEKDLFSRTIHRWWEREGIEFDRSGEALTDLRSPVVSTFSTGVLEAAARGLDAWVYHSRPPAWLREFWQRYGMNQWGEAPTPAPDPLHDEPARLIADIVSH